MKPERGGHVEIAVGVMYPVKPPQQRNFVGDQVLRPNCQIKNQNSQQNL